MFIQTENLSAQIFNDCKEDIAEFCSFQNSVNDIIFCLKRRSNLLKSKCFDYVALKLNEMKKEHTAPIPTQIPHLPQIVPVQGQKIIVPLQSEQDARYNERLAKCKKDWVREWWGQKEKNCDLYAKINPDKATSDCIADLSDHRKTSEEQFTYDVEIHQMCVESFMVNRQWKECFKKNKLVRRDYIITYNMCAPKIKSCIDRLNGKGTAQFDSKISDYYYKYCFSNYNQSEKSFNCIIDMIKNGDSYLSNADEVGKFCADESRECIDYVVKNSNTIKLTFDEHRKISQMCSLSLEKKKSFKDALCYYQSQQKYQLDTSDLALFCESSSKATKDCLALAIKKGISIDYAKEKICVVNSPQIQECLMDYFTHIKIPPYSTIRGDTSSGAFWYCSLEDSSGQECFLKKIEKEGSNKDEEFRKIASSCRKEHPDFEKCYEDYIKYFKKDYLITFASKEIGVMLCEVPIKEMRLCLLDLLIDPDILISRTTFFNSKAIIDLSFGNLYGHCHAKVLKNLFSDMSDNGQKWSCRNAPFEELSLEDQNTKCNRFPFWPDCEKFRLNVIPNILKSDLAPLCKRMEEKLYLQRGPLFAECRKRNLIN